MEAADQALISFNGLSPAAVMPNVLLSSTVTASALSASSMAPAALSAIQDPGSTGDLLRQLLRFEVDCAFDPNRSFTFSWTDTSGVLHEEAYPGVVGLAPEWANAPLNGPGQKWVSACLAARLNAEGATVELSVRGAIGALATTPSEAAAYPMREGVFFGNLFSSSPAVYACYDPTTTTLAVFEKRVCAQIELLGGVLGYDCGPIQVLGPCTQVLGLVTVGVCSSEDRRYRYLYGCVPPGASSSMPSITTFLPL